MRYGAGTSRVGQTAETAMVFLKGLPVEDLREIVAEAVDSAFRPHVYRGALDLVARHRERGERSFIVSAALQEIVDALVAELGFDGGLGSTAEVESGVYTGRVERRLDGKAKAEALVPLAAEQGIDLAESTAYSDSASDVPFLEAVGNPVAVNPDRRLRRIAAERSWRVLRFSDKAYPGAVTEAEARERLLGLGFDPAAVAALVAHFADAERRGKAGHGFARVDWLSSLDLDPSARPFSSSPRKASSVGTGTARSAISCSMRSCEQRSPIRPSVRVSSSRDVLPDGRTRVLGATARRGRARRCSDGDVAAPSCSSRRRPAADRDEPACDRDSVERRQPDRRGRLDGRGHGRRRARGRATEPTSWFPSAARMRTRRSRSQSARAPRRCARGARARRGSRRRPTRPRSRSRAESARRRAAAARRRLADATSLRLGRRSSPRGRARGAFRR